MVLSTSRRPETWSSVVAEGLISPNPPSLSGRDSRPLVSLEPVRDRINTWWMAFSKGCRISLIPGMVLDKYVHQLESPWTKAE